MTSSTVLTPLNHISEKRCNLMTFSTHFCNIHYSICASNCTSDFLLLLLCSCCFHSILNIRVYHSPLTISWMIIQYIYLLMYQWAVVQVNLRGISEPHCSHQNNRSILYLCRNISKGVIQTIYVTMHSIEGHNLIFVPLSEWMLLEYHEIYKPNIGYAKNLCRDKEVIK